MTEKKSIYVVATCYADDPHPHVEAVYDNEETAERHKEAIGRNTSVGGPVAWTVIERPLESSIEKCVMCDDSDLREKERPSPLNNRMRCDNCWSEI